MRRPSRLRGALQAVVLAVGLTWVTALALGASSQAQVSHRTLTSNLQRACVWRPLPSADPHPRLYDRFDSVAAVSPRDAWAVGDYYTGHEGGPNGAFIERWNGGRWNLTGPILPGAILQSVSASGARDVWAVGQAGAGRQLLEHWDGRHWRAMAPPRYAGILNGVVALTPGDAWAVGARSLGSGGKTLVEHWDGARWTVVPSPNPPVPSRQRYAVLRTVTAISATDVWAAGYSGAVRSPATRTLIEHWNGRRWTIVPSPSVRARDGVVDNLLFGLSGSGRGDVWAVGSWGALPGGYGGKGDHALALHWDGHRWSRVAGPAVGPRSLLTGVVTAAGRVWAVGDRGLQPHQQTLIEHWNGTRWTITPSPLGFSLAAATRSPDGAVWAVGANGPHPFAARC
jgi:hypothetical protein